METCVGNEETSERAKKGADLQKLFFGFIFQIYISKGGSTVSFILEKLILQLHWFCLQLMAEGLLFTIHDRHL